ncbi:MAG: divergent polysaccharide deacetylase family protein [Rhizobiales bacterium]|nr:divergent polysaccharide deacetylase family protein [Hyphomicrobiales bacterium]
MPRDELNEPLRRRSWWARIRDRKPSAPAAAAIVLAGIMVIAGLWLMTSSSPYGGEPVLVLDVPPATEMATASISPPTPVAKPAPAATEEPEPSETVDIVIDETPDEPRETYSPGDAQIVQNEASIIISPRRSLPPAPIASVTQEGPDGPLPRIGSGGKKPATVYARTASANLQISDAPKIAIVLGGMGLNQELTARAIKALPGDVSFAFAPYGENLQTQVNKARAAGHEIMLQLPMEPFGYPATNPGPKTLLRSADAATNNAALLWHMSRFAGYIGVSAYMGGNFLADPTALRPVLAELKKRGLYFLEDVPSQRSAASDVGRIVGLPVLATHIVIDADADARAIAAALARLEDEARQSGLAIGSGTGLEVTIEEVQEWAKSLNDRGFLLIPLSAAFRGRTG